MSCKIQNRAAGVLRTAYSESALPPAPMSHSFVAEQFRYPAFVNRQMVRGKNGERDPSLVIWEPSWTHVSKGRKHQTESINYVTGEKETLLTISDPICFYFAEGKLVIERNLIALGLLLAVLLSWNMGFCCSRRFSGLVCRHSQFQGVWPE